MPPLTIGPARFKTILLETAFTQLVAAPVMVTLDGPVTVKSLPSGATELQSIFFSKTNCKELGAHVNAVKLSIGVGATAKPLKAMYFHGNISATNIKERVTVRTIFYGKRIISRRQWIAQSQHKRIHIESIANGGC